MENPLQRALNKAAGNVLFLDGGLATHLKTLGQDISGSLWSAKLLITNPSIITKAHYDYLKNGSNIIITCSYQASIKGFISNPYNLTYKQAVDKMSESVVLAGKAIDKYRNENQNNPNESLIIAASIGCYGAGLADGSEYTGYYGDNMNEFDLREYHSVKMHATMKMRKSINYDIILACETIPNVMEIKVLSELLNEYEYYGWITMTCCNERQLSSKELVIDAIDTIIKYNKKNYVIGIGFNCTHPKYIDDLLKLTKTRMKQRNKDFILIVYPNSGEEWDGKNKSWKPNTTMTDWQYGQCSLNWFVNGARIIGGCCRTTPNTINVMRNTILNYVNSKSSLQSKL